MSTSEEQHGGGASRSTDPAFGSSSATDVSLREYFESRLEATERVSRERMAQLQRRMQAIEETAAERLEVTRREITAAFAASEKAIEKADVATEKRFESVNEFRAQLSDQTSTFMPREIVEPRLAALEKFQWKLLGGMALALILVPTLTFFATYVLTRHAIPASK